MWAILEGSLTFFTSEWPLFLVYFCYMSWYSSFWRKSQVTYDTIKRLVVLMNCWDVIFQVLFSRKSFVANIALVWLFSFMNGFNVIFQTSRVSIFGIAAMTIVIFLQFFSLVSLSCKGQLNSEWIYEVILFPKIPTKNYRDSALPSNKLLCNFWLEFCKKSWPHEFILNLTNL